MVAAPHPYRGPTAMNVKLPSVGLPVSVNNEIAADPAVALNRLMDPKEEFGFAVTTGVAAKGVVNVTVYVPEPVVWATVYPRPEIAAPVGPILPRMMRSGSSPAAGRNC